MIFPTVCVKCLHPLRDADRAVEFDPKSEGLVVHAQPADGVWHICKDTEACGAEQRLRQAAHDLEIALRVRNARARGQTHLVVIQDSFGHRYGYGNYYVAVNPGETIEEATASYMNAPDSADLIVSATIEIE